MKLFSVENLDEDCYKWVATFTEYSKREPIKRVIFGDGKPSYIDTHNHIQRREWRDRHSLYVKYSVHESEKLEYYLLYGDSTSLTDNIKTYKGLFKL